MKRELPLPSRGNPERDREGKPQGIRTTIRPELEIQLSPPDKEGDANRPEICGQILGGPRASER